MKYPNADDYGLFYDVRGKPTPEYDRYARDVSAWHDELAQVEHLLAYLSRGGIGPGLDREMVTLGLLKLHRTQQENVARNLRTILEAIAQLEYDDRNEAAVRFAATALDATKGIALPFI